MWTGICDICRKLRPSEACHEIPAVKPRRYPPLPSACYVSWNKRMIWTADVTKLALFQTGTVFFLRRSNTGTVQTGTVSSKTGAGFFMFHEGKEWSSQHSDTKKQVYPWGIIIPARRLGKFHQRCIYTRIQEALSWFEHGPEEDYVWGNWGWGYINNQTSKHLACLVAVALWVLLLWPRKFAFIFSDPQSWKIRHIIRANYQKISNDPKKIIISYNLKWSGK